MAGTKQEPSPVGGFRAARLLLGCRLEATPEWSAHVVADVPSLSTHPHPGTQNTSSSATNTHKDLAGDAYKKSAELALPRIFIS